MPNIEFSCPAVSTQHYMELPDCMHGFTRPLRGQLQRFVVQSLYAEVTFPKQKSSRIGANGDQFSVFFGPQTLVAEVCRTATKRPGLKQA